MSDKNLTEIKINSSGKTQVIDITRKVADAVGASGVKDGMCFVYVPHTTAGVTINENADPDVKSDILMGLGEIVPGDLDYAHAEGNSPAHIKASLLGSSASVFVSGGKPVLGTWQGVYFCEFDGPRPRKVYVKVIGG